MVPTLLLCWGSVLDGKDAMAKAIADWIHEGEAVYAAALKEYRDLEARCQELEAQVEVTRDKAIRILQLIHHRDPQRHQQVLARLIDRRGPQFISSGGLDA